MPERGRVDALLTFQVPSRRWTTPTPKVVSSLPTRFTTPPRSTSRTPSSTLLRSLVRANDLIDMYSESFTFHCS